MVGGVLAHADVPPGCPYAARCPLATDLCRDQNPPLVADAEGRRVACWYADEVPTLPDEVVAR